MVALYTHSTEWLEMKNRGKQGYGFYTTTNKMQAIGFADKVTKRRKEGIPTVSVYEIDEMKAFEDVRF